MIYEAVNGPVLARVPQTTKRVLDLGCGSGALGERLRKEISCQVIGVTCSESEAELARKRLNQVLVRDLNSFDPSEVGNFDCIICSHVLEHLFNPHELLKRLRRSLLPGGALIVALPNVLHWRQRLQFVRGRFEYTEGGLMDRTHYRFFDWHTARVLLADSGYRVIEEQACGSFPLSRFLFRFGDWMDRVMLKMFPGLLGFQFVFVCEPGQSNEIKQT